MEHQTLEARLLELLAAQREDHAAQMKELGSILRRMDSRMDRLSVEVSGLHICRACMGLAGVLALGVLGLAGLRVIGSPTAIQIEQGP